MTTSAGSMEFINHILPLTENTSYGGEMADHTPPCIEGKCATSNRGMVYINPLDFVTEVYLLTIFTLVRKKHRTGGKQRGDHIQPPKEGMWATSAKNIN